MGHVEDKLLPIKIGSSVLVLAAIALWRETAARGKPGTTVSGEEKAREGEVGAGLRQYLLAGVWVVVFFPVAVYLVGVIVTIPLFVFSYMKSHGTGWLTTIIFTVLTPIFIYGVFAFTLKVDLYPGLHFTWLG